MSPQLKDHWTIYADSQGKEWAEPFGEDCPICVAAFPHRHSLLEDGTFGAIVEMVDERMVDRINRVFDLNPGDTLGVVLHTSNPKG